MNWLALFLLAGPSLHFDITDARGHKASGVTIEAGAPDPDGWSQLKLTKSPKNKADIILIWPFDGEAKLQDGSGEIPAIVIERGDARAPRNPHIVAAIITPVVLGLATLEQRAQVTGLDPAALAEAAEKLTTSTDPFEKGVGLFYKTNPIEALTPLNEAYKQRQRQLTRVPSEIYPVAMIYGRALVQSKKFDEAAVSFLIALRQRASDEWALKARAEALKQVGKGTKP